MIQRSLGHPEEGEEVQGYGTALELSERQGGVVM
jgi:hypothetical protein